MNIKTYKYLNKERNTGGHIYNLFLKMYEAIHT